MSISTVESDLPHSGEQASSSRLDVYFSALPGEVPPPLIDAHTSRLGWGAILPPHKVSGRLSVEESLDHIKSLELRAVFLALQSLVPHVVGQSLMVRSDNMIVVSYINLRGGTHSRSVCVLAVDPWNWCIQRNIFLSTSHIPRNDNLVADFLSRGSYLPSEWMLKHSVFHRIRQVVH